MNQSQFLAITCNSLKAREKSCVHSAIGFGFGFASHWLKNWCESFEPITKRSNRNHVITFDSHLKTTLKVRFGATVFASLRRRVRRTLFGLYCPYFSPNVMVNLTRRVRGHFVTLIEVSVHLIT